MYKTGDILYVDFAPKSVAGYCVAGPHLCIVLRAIDRYKLLVVPFTTQKLDKIHWSEVIFMAGEGNLEKNCKAQPTQFQNISTNRVIKYIGRVSYSRTKVVDNLFRQATLF